MWYRKPARMGNVEGEGRTRGTTGRVVNVIPSCVDVDGVEGGRAGMLAQCAARTRAWTGITLWIAAIHGEGEAGEEEGAEQSARTCVGTSTHVWGSTTWTCVPSLAKRA